ncbi:MAG: VWA domain-containing protein [Bacteroidales bacterium]|nr:VWA domain-containing protein [Bacteroidales bacterium]
MQFANPGYLFLLILLIPAIAWYIWKQSEAQASLQVSSTSAFQKLPRSWKEYLRHVNFALLCGAAALTIVALARPQSSDSWSQSNTEGIDIVLSLDVSNSMHFEDFRPDRLEASKEVASRFVAGRPNDNIGLVLFGSESYTMCPMTSDHAVVANMINSVTFDLIDGGSTAIGDGLVTAVNRIRSGQAKSKVIILLTDGSNNSGDVSPKDAAQVAHAMGVRLYTIGVGSKGEFETTVGYDPFGRPVRQKVKADIDEETLKTMAQFTGGRYFRATNKNSLAEIFDEIDKMEKTKMSVREFSRKEEEFLPFALAAIALLLLHVILRNTVLRNIP